WCVIGFLTAHPVRCFGWGNLVKLNARAAAAPPARPLAALRRRRGTTTPGGPRAPALPAELRWRPTRSVWLARRRRATRVRWPRGAGKGRERGRGGSGIFNRCVARSSGGEVRGAAALAPLPVGEGAPGAGRGRHRTPASPHPLRPQRPPVLQPGKWGWRQGCVSPTGEARGAYPGGRERWRPRASPGEPGAVGEGARRACGPRWAEGLGPCRRASRCALWSVREKVGRGIAPASLYHLFSLLRVKDSLSRLFTRCGPVQSVEICDKPGPREKKEKQTSKFFNRKTVTGFQVAYVVFRKPAGVQAAKTLSREGPLLISTESHPVKTGISKWIASYAASVVDREELKAEVDAYMQDYDKKIAEEEAKAAKQEGVPDEEGWVKVTRKGRKPGLPRTEAANLRMLEKEKQKRARKELLNFYAWQHRETKREHIAQLRKKFEEDKQRIALMRAQRKFRPY
uniref:Ribosomal RNA processing 7 homolog A n=1 Tax=Accipiter nisus TaxID=211598 RepID=A0A8B9MPG8_9AVES